MRRFYLSPSTPSLVRCVRILPNHRTISSSSISNVNISNTGNTSNTSSIFTRAFSNTTKTTAVPKMTTPRKITDWVDPKDKSGEFKRQVSAFRDWIGKADADGTVRYPAVAGRYHLYVSYACPWATRALIARKLKGLEKVVSMSSVHWQLGEGGWHFVAAADTDAGAGAGETAAHAPWEAGIVPDPVAGHDKYTHLRQVYEEAEPAYTGRITVPVLYDTERRTIVSNESSDILRMFGTAFDGLPEKTPDAVVPGGKLDLYPAALRDAIEEAFAWHYDLINNGVYKSGFATTQEAYERNVVALFGALDRAEQHLAANAAAGKGPYWFGQALTEVDVRLFVTIVRFDPVYVQHFKCNLKDIRSGYPHLHRWTRFLYWQVPAFRESTNFLHIKNHYTKSHTQINPFSITPLGPMPDILPLDEEVAAVAFAKK